MFCIRPRIIREAVAHFRSCFPGRALYAVKCNPHPFVVRAVLEAGIRDFDVASLPEIALVRALSPQAGLHFMHPVKERRAIRPLWAEPGRALVAAGCSVVVQVRLRKGDQLYVNDGVYGCFSELIDSNHELPARLLPQRGRPSGTLREFEVHGPTCDSMDVLTSPLRLPDTVAEGDWIEVDQLGAYSTALSTRFNGFAVETFAEVFDEPPARTWPTGASSSR